MLRLLVGGRLSKLPPTALAPLKGRLLIEPAYDPATVGSLIVPDCAIEHRPQVGFVLATGELDEAIEIGDLVLFPVNATANPLGYYKITVVAFNDSVLRTHEDSYDIINETWQKYLKNRTSRDYLVRCKSLDDKQWEFMASEIVYVSFDEVANPLYIFVEYADAVYIIPCVDEELRERVLYIIHENQIEAVLNVK